MASGEDFAAACKEHARKLRRLQKDVRRELSAEVKAAVAEPMASDIRAAWSGPYAYPLSQATKARAGADPQVVVGGTRPRLSGGATPRDLVFGSEFGGAGGRSHAVLGYSRSRTGRNGRGGRVRGYARVTTNQFRRGGQHAVLGTLGRNFDRYIGLWADAVEKILGRSL